jgi:protein ImuA
MKEKLKIKYLEQQIRAIASGGKEHARLPFGVAEIDASLLGGGLALGALHEIEGAGPEVESGAAAAAFLAGILARLAPERPVLWCLEEADLYVPGLELLGLAPHRLILAHATRDQEILWAMEEGLRCRALAAVVGEVKALPALASRRLQLAAESAGVTAFVLPRGGRETATSMAMTRWRIAALPSSLAADKPGVGQPLWRVDLLRCRGGVPASWIVEASNATGHVALSAALADRVLSSPQRAVG